MIEAFIISVYSIGSKHSKTLNRHRKPKEFSSLLCLRQSLAASYGSFFDVDQTHYLM